jgi:hypothetical protein
MSQVHYYQVERRGPSWSIIRKILKQREAAFEARRTLIESEYPDWKRGDWQMTVCAPRIWGIVPPADAKGFAAIPDGWRAAHRGNVGYVPKKNHPIGKRLAAEMASDKCMVPGCSELANALGIKAYFAPGSGHMVLHTAGLEVPRKETYVLLHPEQKAPPDCTRISDLEFEALSKRKSRKTPE